MGRIVLVIPESFKQDLLSRIDIVDVINARVPLKKAGANWSACCPFHTEKTPSFSVSPAKQFYHCFGCGAHGNAIGFLMEYAGLGYVDAMRDLAESVGMKLPEFTPSSAHGADAPSEPEGPDLYDIMSRAAKFYREALKDSPRAIDYLKGRGLSGQITARFGLGYASNEWQGLERIFPDYAGKALSDCGLVIVNEQGKRYDRFRDRVMFPILNRRGQVIGFGGRVVGEGEPKYLNSPETSLFEKGRELYGLPQARLAIREQGRVIVVEGYMDVVALAQHGIENAVATLGTATTPIHVSKLLQQTDEVVFCFDGDAAGRRAAWHALEVSLAALGDRKALRFLFLPPEHDPDSFVRAHGREGFEQKLAEAQPLSAFLLTQLKSENDIATVEGRARFIHQAKPLVLRVAAPAMRLQLLKEVSAIAGMTPDEAAQLFDMPRPARPAGRAAPARVSRQAPSLTRHLLNCLMANPRLAAELPPGIRQPSSFASRALGELALACREAEGTLHAVVMDRFRDTEYESLMRELLADYFVLEFTEEQAASEFEAVLRQWRVEDIRMQIKGLEEKDGRMTAQEKERYATLIKEQAALRTALGASSTML